jgi:glucosylceramidase
MHSRKTVAMWLSGVALLGVAWVSNAGDSPPLLPNAETPAQLEARLAWWREARFGLFIHWGPSSLSGKEISWSRIGHPHDHPGLESVPADVYDNLYRRFNPTNFNADAWMQLARDAGMKYVVFTAKHHDGFSMWPTQLRPDYSIAATPFHRDICGELAAAAHRQGVKLGWFHVLRWSGDTLELPPLKARVARATALTGGTVRIDQTPTRIAVQLAIADQSPTDSVIQLDLDAPAAREFVEGKPLAVTDPVPLTVDAPRDYQVFQRRPAANGQVRFSGRIPKGADTLEARLTGPSVHGDLPGTWQPLPVDAKDGTFNATLETPSGGWYRCELRASRQGAPMGSVTIPHVAVGEVFVVAGQSNAGNHGSERQRPASDRVVAFDGARWQPANDPQPGSSGDSGSFIPAFGDALVNNLGVPVGVACIAAGGTSVREWLPKGTRMKQQPTTGAHVRAVGTGEWESTGELFDRFKARFSALGTRGFRAVLWHQGESDAGQARAGYPADRQITATQYSEFMKSLIRSARTEAGWEVPWLTAVTTYHSERDPADDEFRAAQRGLWAPGVAVEGPDTDALRAEFRDGVHFNARGLRRHGEIWAEKVAAWLKSIGISGPSAGTTGAAPGSAPTAIAAVQTEVELWLTHPDRTARFQKQRTAFLEGDPPVASPTVTLDPAKTYQVIDGFGYTLTGGSTLHLMRMSATARAAVLRELFATDSTNIGVSYLRVSVGASDLNERPYSYDDMPAGETDPDLARFTLDPDRADVIPILKQILALNPTLKIMASPWSAPPWMKTKPDFRGGSLKRECYDFYARYLVRYIQGMRAEGIPIDALTVQNEPLHPGNNPSMLMVAADQADFIKRHLGPAFKTAGLTTKIVCYDHNADRPDYPLAILNDPEAKPFVEGSAFHLYGGRIEALSTVHEAHPDRSLYFTEQWIGAPGNLKGDLAWHTTQLIVGATRNWCRTVLQWNLASDPQYRPHTDRGGCDRCLGAITIAGDTVVRNPAYYIIAHAAKFVRPGSVRIDSTLPATLPNVAFRTPSGRSVLIVLNRESRTQPFLVRCATSTFATSLPAGAVGTYVW